MTELFFDCLSEFQKVGVCKIYDVMRERKVPEFNATILLPVPGMEEYGLAVKFSIGVEYPIFWVYQESYQLYAHKNDDYGKTVEKIDVGDDLQVLIEKFEGDLRDHFKAI